MQAGVQMGLFGRIFGGNTIGSVGKAVSDVVEVFRPNANELSKMTHETRIAVLDQFSGEFANSGSGWFDQLVNGLNRLPRPLLALGTMGLFVYAMIDPVAFSERMKGLGYVPDPLWWLLGAVVSFYFGARELHYARRNRRGRRVRQATKAAAARPTDKTRDQWAEGS